MRKSLAAFIAAMSVTLLCPGLLHAVVVRSVSGDVFIQRRGSEAWMHARPKMTLAEGDKIKTSADAWALIFQAPGAKIVMRQKTIVAVDDTHPDNSGFSLIEGKALVMMKDKRQGQNLVIKTMGGSVESKDALFELEMAEGKGVMLFVMEGGVKSKDVSEMQLAKGQTYMLHPGATPSTLAVVPPDTASSIRTEDKAVSLTDSDRKTNVRREAALFAMQDSWEEAVAREIQSNEFQEGRVSVDSSGHRYRREDYLVRPAANEFSYITLTNRNGHNEFTKLAVVAHTTLPEDLSSINLYQDENNIPMTNWAVRTERISSNGTDYYREWQVGGHPITMNGTSQSYKQVVFTDWYIEYKAGSSAPVLLTHWQPRASYDNAAGGNPADIAGDLDIQNDGVRDEPRGYVDFVAGGGTAGVGNDRPIDSAGLTVAQRLDITNSTVASLYANSEGYNRTAIALVDDTPFTQLSSVQQLNNSTKTSRLSTYDVPGSAAITLRSDRYYLNSEGQKTPFSERSILSADVQGLTLETAFSSSLGGTINSKINPTFFFQTDLTN